MLQNAGSIYTASCIHCKRCQNAMRKSMFYNMKCGKLECKRYAFTIQYVSSDIIKMDVVVVKSQSVVINAKMFFKKKLVTHHIWV